MLSNQVSEQVKSDTDRKPLEHIQMWNTQICGKNVPSKMYK